MRKGLEAQGLVSILALVVLLMAAAGLRALGGRGMGGL
jgi:hypothetical protein